MSILRNSLSVTLCLALAQPTVALASPPPPPPPGGSGVQPEAPPDPSTLSDKDRLEWAKRLFKEAKEAHDREDFYNSVIRFEQAYSFAPDKHIFAFNIGQDAWELKDCARVKQYLELFLVKEQNNADLRKKAQELLQKAENNPECVTGGPAPSSGGGGGGGTLIVAKGKSTSIEEAGSGGNIVKSFPQGTYSGQVADDMASLQTLNIVTPILLGAGGALLIGGIAMIAIDRGNKKKGKGFYAKQPRVELTGLGASPLPGGGATGSLSLRF